MMSETRVKEEHLKEALVAHKGEKALLMAWKTGEFLQKGDVYTSDVIRIEITYKISDQTQTTVWVAKMAPKDVNDLERKESRGEYEREINFYQKILPELSSILRESGLEDLRVPKCLFASLEKGKELIIFEDLREKMFWMPDWKISLSFAHVELVIRELAKLHASAYILQKKDYDQSILHPEQLTTLKDNTTYFGDILSLNVENSLRVLKDSPNYEKAVKWLEENGKMCTDIASKHLLAISPFSILCHGSCWMKNFLFRYDENNKPSEVMLLDFQYPRKSSVVIEIQELLYKCVDGVTRKRHLNSLLTTYYEYFTKISIGCGATLTFNEEEIFQEYKERLECGFLLSLSQVLLTIYGDEGFPKYTGPPGDEVQLETFRNYVKIKTIEKLNANAHLKHRFYSIFDDMIEFGVM